MAKRTIQRGGDTISLTRIGQRRQIVIPKKIFDELALAAGDFMEVTAKYGRMAMKPKKLVDAGDTLTASEAKKVRHGLKQVKAGKTRPWIQIKHELGL